MPKEPTLKARLDGLCRLYGGERAAAADPIGFPRRHARDDDREVAGFIAAARAYGRVALALQVLADEIADLFLPLGEMHANSHGPGAGTSAPTLALAGCGR